MTAKGAAEKEHTDLDTGQMECNIFFSSMSFLNFFKFLFTPVVLDVIFVVFFYLSHDAHYIKTSLSGGFIFVKNVN